MGLYGNVEDGSSEVKFSGLMARIAIRLGYVLPEPCIVLLNKEQVEDIIVAMAQRLEAGVPLSSVNGQLMAMCVSALAADADKLHRLVTWHGLADVGDVLVFA